jgi:hypothetical protein
VARTSVLGRLQREKSKKPVKTKPFNDFSTLHRLPGSV